MTGINAVTAKYGVSTTDATKVVPIIGVGDGSRAGLHRYQDRSLRWIR